LRDATKQEQDCHLREHECNSVGWNGRITEIG